MQRKIFIYTLMILLAFSLASLLQLKAQAQGEQQFFGRQLKGKVTALSEQSITIVDEAAEPDTADALPHSFIINDKTIIKGQVSEGKEVIITYYIKEADATYIKRVALMIEVMESQ